MEHNQQAVNETKILVDAMHEADMAMRKAVDAIPASFDIGTKMMLVVAMAAAGSQWFHILTMLREGVSKFDNNPEGGPSGDEVASVLDALMKLKDERE